MTQYLGICMVVLVSALCIAVLARLVTGGILEEIEKIRDKRRQRRVKLLVDAIKDTVPYVERYVKSAKEAMKMDKELGEKGAKYAGKAFDSTIDEMLKDNDLK